MIYRETENVFKAFVKKYGEYLAANSLDVFVAPHIPAEVISSVCMNFGILSKEKILFVRDTSFQNDKDQGTVITNRGIYHLPDNDYRDDIFFLPWHKISQVTFYSNAFYFYLYGEEYPFVIERKNILKENYQELVSDIQTAADRVKTSAGYLFQGAACWKESFDRVTREESVGMNSLKNYGEILRNSFTLGNAIGSTVGGVLGVFSSRKAQKKEQENLICELLNYLAAIQRATYTDYFDEEYDNPTEGTYNKHYFPA